MNFHFLFFSVVLEGEEIEKEHCLLEFMKGKGVKLDPISTLCWVNGVAISQATKLNQGKDCFTKLSTCFSEGFSLSISNYEYMTSQDAHANTVFTPVNDHSEGQVIGGPKREKARVNV